MPIIHENGEIEDDDSSVYTDLRDGMQAMPMEVLTPPHIQTVQENPVNEEPVSPVSIEVSDEPEAVEVVQAVEVVEPVSKVTDMQFKISDELYTIISSFREETAVGYFLSFLRNGVLCMSKDDFAANHLGISNEDMTKLSYLDDSRFNRIMETHGASELYTPNKRYHASIGKVIRKVITSISTKDDDTEGYDVYLRTLITESLNKDEYVRSNFAINELINNAMQRGNLTYAFLDCTIDSFANKLRVAICSCNAVDNILIVSGSAIKHFYHENNYAAPTGQLGASCMRYTRCKEYLDIYTRNQDICTLAVLTDDNLKVKARSLVWNIEGKMYHDRIYGINDLEQDRLRAYFLSKEIENCYNINSELVIVKPDGHFTYNRYPYMDTFMFTDENRSILTNQDEYFDSGEDYFLMRDTGGGISRQRRTNYEQCECCGAECHEDDLYYIERRGDPYQHQNICSDCSVYSDVYDQTISDTEAVEVRWAHNRYRVWVLQQDSREDLDGDFVYCEDAVQLVDGQYALSTETVELYEGGYIVPGHDDFLDYVDAHCENMVTYLTHMNNVVVDIYGKQIHTDFVVSMPELGENKYVHQEELDNYYQSLNLI